MVRLLRVCVTIKSLLKFLEVALHSDLAELRGNLQYLRLLLGPYALHACGREFD